MYHKSSNAVDVLSGGCRQNLKTNDAFGRNYKCESLISMMHLMTLYFQMQEVYPQSILENAIEGQTQHVC